MSKTALVTGGTRGIGFGIARALAKEGWTLALGGMRPEADVQSALEELRALGAAVHYVRGDLALRDDRRSYPGQQARHCEQGRRPFGPHG